MLPLEEDVFNSTIKKRFKFITYEDHKRTVAMWNMMDGFHPNEGVGIRRIDLLDRKARCGSAGTVILVAHGDSTEYEVFNTATQERETYNKKDRLKKAGNSILILATLPEGVAYTIVYSQLSEKASIVPGDEVKAGDILGEVSNGAKSVFEKRTVAA